MEPSVHTASADACKVGDRILLRRYRPDSTINQTSVAENVEAGRFLPGPAPEAVIVVIPESARFALSFVEVDPCKLLGLDRVTHVLAWVAEGALYDQLHDFRLPHQPAGVHFKVFPRMEEARAWVEDRMD